MQRNIVKLPISELIAGIFVTLVFSSILLMMVLFQNDSADLYTFLGIGLFMTMGIVIILSWFIWKVEYNDEVFVYRNRLGHKTTVLYSNINKVKLTLDAIHLYVNHQRYTIYRKSKNVDGFLEILSKRSWDGVEIIDRVTI